MIENCGVLSTSEKDRSQNPTVLRFEVEDIEEAVNELKCRGVQATIHVFKWGKIGVIIDPEGNRIEIKEY